MWPFKKRLKQRRLEVRKNIPPPGPSVWDRLRTSGGIPALLLGVVFFLAAGLMDAWPVEPFVYHQGQYLHADVYARVPFTVPAEQPSDPARTGEMPATTPAAGSTGGAQTKGPLSDAKVYQGGDLLVQRTRKPGDGEAEIHLLTATQVALLRSEHEAYLTDQRQNNPWRFWSRMAGRAGIILLITALLCLYVGKYHPQYVSNPWRSLALVAVLLLMLALNKVMGLLLGWNAYSAVLPVLLGALVLTIAHDQRFALAGGAALAGLVVLQQRADIMLLVVLLAAVAVSVFQLREIRTRTKLIEISVVSAVIIALAVLGRGFAAGMSWRFVVVDILWATGAALLAGFLIQGGLPLIERVFRVATSMTLLEWCDASRPLLKRLAMEAPGSYNHSLQLGTMCEAAAETIGARGLLARVGAYYHDIGKMNKPDYFVENEAGAASRHEKLSPAMSLLIIIGHVKDGVELAHEYSLPSVLHEFIAAHHGTTLVRYFYHAAAEQRKNDTDRAPDEVEFRYPGPKPQSKEAAILMLADASESSVRAMNQPTPGHIETQVHDMVTQRLNDGQLDECEVTLKEVHRIEHSLTKSLCSIYHSRISYPKPPESKSPSKTPTEGAAEENTSRAEAQDSAG